MSGDCDLDYPARGMDMILSFAKHELERYDLTEPAQFDAVNEAVMHHIADIVTWLAREAKAQRERANAAQACGHGEIHPYVPEGYEQPVSGIYRCVACDEVLVEIKCRGCDIEMLPHQMPAHLAEQCWAT